MATGFRRPIPIPRNHVNHINVLLGLFSHSHEFTNGITDKIASRLSKVYAVLPHVQYVMHRRNVNQSVFCFMDNVDVSERKTL